MKDQESDKNEFNVCTECGLHYELKEMMEKCQAWCAQYKSCNLEITKHSIEYQNRSKLVDN